MGRRRFTENEILALTKNRLEDKHLTERLQQIREAKSILQDENKKEKRNLIEICKDYRRNTGKSPWSRTEPLRSKDGKIELKDMKKYSKPWAYCPSETTFNVLFQECSYSGRQKTLYLKSQLNLSSSRPNSLKTPVSPRRVITTPRNVQSSVGRFCHLDSLQMESFDNSEGKVYDVKKSINAARPKSCFENSDGIFCDSKGSTDLAVRPKSLSILNKEMTAKPSTGAWDDKTETNCNKSNHNGNNNKNNNRNNEDNEFNNDKKEEAVGQNVLKSNNDGENQLTDNSVLENQSYSVLNIGDIDQTTGNTNENKDLISGKNSDTSPIMLDSKPNYSINTTTDKNESGAEINALSMTPTVSDSGRNSIVKANVEQNARSKNKIKKKRSPGKKRVSITTNDMDSGGRVSNSGDSLRDMSMDNKSVIGQFHEQNGQNVTENGHFESSPEQVLQTSEKLNCDNIMMNSNNQQCTERLRRSDVTCLDNRLDCTVENQTSGSKTCYSGEETGADSSKTNNRETDFSLPAPKHQDPNKRPTTCPTSISAVNNNIDALRQETSSVPNVSETTKAAQNLPETPNVAFDEHFLGHDFLSFHDDYEEDDRDYIVFRGKKIHDYVKPQDRYKHDPFKMKRREKLFKKLAQDTTLVNGDRNSNLNFNLTFSKASRKRILNQLVQENSSSVNQVKINAWDKTLPNRIQDFFDSIHPFCKNS